MQSSNFQQANGLGDESTMRIVSAKTGAMISLGRRQLPAALSREARVRLSWLDWYTQHGCNASRTCRRFGISRQTFYRWQPRYDPRRLSSLEARSSRPRRRRLPSWSSEQVLAVQALREAYPRWGKDKLAVLLARQGVHLSVSMVGRMLVMLRRRGDLVEPPLRRISARKRLLARPHATRKPKEYQVQAPGDLVQLDTMDVNLPGCSGRLKQFTARDYVSRYDVLTLRSAATAGLALHSLEAIIERMPFPVKAIQVDGGSEFMAEFEQACLTRQIRLFVLPPRSPKLNGRVERANRTHTEEFYECSTAAPTVAELGTELRQWEVIYNTIRPHQALGYLTPKEFLEHWNQQPDRKEVRCH